MDLEIISDTKNDVIKRREVQFYIMQDSKTPSKEEVKQEICKKLNLHPDSTIIVTVSQAYGTRRSKAVAHSYHDAGSMKRFEHQYFFERLDKSAKKKAGAAQEAKEEKKEENKEAKAENK